MIKVSYLCFLLVLSISSYAQNNPDSLMGVWNDKTKADTIRLDAMNEFAYSAFRFVGPDSLMNLADEMLELATTIGFKRYQVDAAIQQCRSYLFLGNDEKALEIALGASELSNKIDYLYGEARTLALISVVYERMGDPLKAVEYLNKMYEICNRQVDRPGQPIFGEIKAFPMKERLIDGYHDRLATIYQNMGAYSKALEHFNLALKAYLLQGNQFHVARLANNIGNVYNSMKEYDQALKYYKEALPVFEVVGHLEFQSNVLGNLANIYAGNKNYDVAEEYMIRHLKVREELGDPFYIAMVYADFSKMEIDRENYEKSLEYTELAEELYLQPRANYDIESGQRFLSKLKMYKGHVYTEQGDFRKAAALFGESYQIASDNYFLSEKTSATAYLYNVYKKAGDIRKSLEYHEELMILRDSLNKDDISKKLLALDFSKKILTDSLLQVEEKNKLELAYEKEILEQTNTRNIFIASGFMLLLVSGGLWNRLSFTRKSKATLQLEKDRSENLLLNILPAEVAEELKANGEAKARDFESVSVIFTDFKGFTQTSENLSAGELVGELNYCFKGFDAIMEKHGIEKIKTIGDAYMAAGGLQESKEDAANRTVRAALEMQKFMADRKSANDAQGKPSFEMRAGIHTGPVVAGIVGVKKFQYDIWGDTVNTASRVESNGKVGRVNISQSTYEAIKEEVSFTFEKREKIDVKGKGEMEMYFVS